MRSIIMDLIYEVSEILNKDPKCYGSIRCRLFEGWALLGEHHNPLRLAMDLMDGVQITDLLVEDEEDNTKGSCPVNITELTSIDVYVG